MFVLWFVACCWYIVVHVHDVIVVWSPQTSSAYVLLTQGALYPAAGGVEQQHIHSCGDPIEAPSQKAPRWAQKGMHVNSIV